jgi:predicted DNA-binding antitoxin AbrB/MazE fold protein
LSKNPKQKLDLKDHPDGGVYVKDLTIMIVKGVRDLQQVMEVQTQRKWSQNIREKHLRRVREVGFQPVYRNGILKPKTFSNHVH